MRKINALVTVILFSVISCFSQDSVNAAALVNQSKLSFEITNNKPIGTGWNLLMDQFAENNFVGWEFLPFMRK